jgi:ABC-type uncharacterized transport system fused permease/ATPase subunit
MHSDQRVAQDIERFSSYLANLYGNVFKPVTDLALFTSKARLASPRLALPAHETVRTRSIFVSDLFIFQ